MIEKIYATMTRLFFIMSVARVLIIVGVIGLVSPDVNDFILIFMGCVAHWNVKRYMGFHLTRFKTLSNSDDFIPLNKWMVVHNSRELTGQEYKELLDEELSPLGRKKFELIKAKQLITVYDYVNLILFEAQVGKPIQTKCDLEKLKKGIRDDS